MINKLKSILLIDDDQINNFINKRIISNLEITDEIEIAINGKDALRRIENYSLKNEDCQNLIFLDINMPVMNGFEFLENFERLNLKNKKEVKIFILTTSSNPSDLLRLKEFNITGFLNKPLTEEKILNLLQSNETVQMEES